MKLCSFCNSSNSNSFELSEDCFICRGSFSKIESMVLEAIKLMSQSKECKTFSVSTLIPKNFLTREEYLWDVKSKSAQSVKNSINRYLVQNLDHKNNLEISSDGDLKLIFDMVSGQVTSSYNELFIFGRYKKFKAGLSQSKWQCFDCSGAGCNSCSGSGKNYDSVEERIGEPAKSAFSSSGYTLHASGREDVDALNTGGRPFCLEIKNPQLREVDLVELSKSIAKTGEVSVCDLKFIRRSDAELVTESHFDKSYSAVTEFGRALTKEDVSKIESLSGAMLDQFTPERVAHRRANITRNRLVKSVRVTDVHDNFATLHITAEAGTYIKELISSDNGRTKPSVSEILSTPAKCILLTVTSIDDQFLSFILL